MDSGGDVRSTICCPAGVDYFAQPHPLVDSTMYRNIRQFPNLTPLRFIAAYLVVIFHVEETRKMFGLPNLTQYSFFAHGPTAVTFFFVLSGFLITYLLLREQGQSSRIDVGRFYVRRILRIWPLYFLMVFIGLVLIPAGIKLGRVRYEAPFEAWEVAPYFMLFLPFVVNLTYGNHFLTPLWSIGVEEIYYLVWAPVLKWFRKHLVAIAVGTVCVKLLLAVGSHYYLQNALAEDALRMLQFEAMAIGALAAYFLYHRAQPICGHWLFSKPIQTVLLSLLVMRLFAHRWTADFSPLYATLFDHPVVTPLLLMAVFAWFILNVAANERSIVRFEWPVLKYLGDISYGIYMYHALAISLLFVPLRDKYQAVPFLPATLLLHLLVAGVTLLLAASSKRFFEDKFLRYKGRLEAAGGQQPAADSPGKEAPASPGALAA
jgi:peptidoglycan/LPS O-acetylase OafA/YrhL